MKVWFLQVGLVTDMADGSGGKTVDGSELLPSLLLIWNGFRPDPDLGSALGLVPQLIRYRLCDIIHKESSTALPYPSVFGLH